MDPISLPPSLLESGLRAMGAQAPKDTRLATQEKREAKFAEDEANKPGILDVAKTALTDPRTTSFRLISQLLGNESFPEDKEAVANGWDYWQHASKVEAGKTIDEIEYLRENGMSGPTALTRAVGELEFRKGDDDVYAKAGLLPTLVGQMMASMADPTNLLIGAGVNLAATRMALGAGRFVAQGRRGAAVAAVAAEGAAGELAFGLLQDASGEVRGLDDYFVDVLGGAVLSTAFSYGTYREAARIHALGKMSDVVPPVTTGAENIADATAAVDSVHVEQTNRVMPDDLTQTIITDVDGPPVLPEVPDVPELVGPGVELVGPSIPDTAPLGPVQPPVLTEVIGLPELTGPGPEVAGPVVPPPPPPKPTAVPNVLERALAAVDSLESSGDVVGAYELAEYITGSPDHEAQAVAFPDLAAQLHDKFVALRDKAGRLKAENPDGTLNAFPFASGEATVNVKWKAGAEGLKGTMKVAKATATRKGGSWIKTTAQDLLTALAAYQGPYFPGAAMAARAMLRFAPPKSVWQNEMTVIAGAYVQGWAGVNSSVVSFPGSFGKAGSVADVVNNATDARGHQTAVHEVAHLLTQSVIMAYEKPDLRAQMAPQVIEALEGLEAIRVRMFNIFGQYQRGTKTDTDGAYAAQNLHELVAQFFNSREVQEALTKLPASKKWGGRLSTAFDEFVQHILSILGVNSRGTAFDETAHYIETVMRATAGTKLKVDAGKDGTTRMVAPEREYSLEQKAWYDQGWVDWRDRMVQAADPAKRETFLSRFTSRYGGDMVELFNKPAGTVHFAGAFGNDGLLVGTSTAVGDAARAVVTKLLSTWLPDYRVLVTSFDANARPGVKGSWNTIMSDPGLAIMYIDADRPLKSMLHTIIHEIGHGIVHQYQARIPESINLREHWKAFVADRRSGDVARREMAAAKRFSVTADRRREDPPIGDDAYYDSFDEYGAEQFVKFIEARADTPANVGLIKGAANLLKEMFATMLLFMSQAKRMNHVKPDVRFEDFFEQALDIAKRDRESSHLPKEREVQEVPQAPGVINPVAVTKTRRDFAERMWQWAEWRMQQKPIDKARLRTLTAKVGGLSDGLRLAGSDNPVMQLVASLVTETTTGAAGRGATVAIRKENLRHLLTGNALLRYQQAYESFRRATGRTIFNDLGLGDARRDFDREVMVEILMRRQRRGGASTKNPAVKAAADELEAMFTRALNAQKSAKTLGSDRLPEDSVGYIPQALDGRKLSNATEEELRELREALANRFVTHLGWGGKFSQQFADFYVERARDRTMNPNQRDMSASSMDGADLLRQSLEDMAANMRDPALADELAKSLRGLGQTKKRLDIDLLERLPSGKLILDFYEDNPIALARRYINRTSGTVALTEVGVPGDHGVRYLRDAAKFAQHHSQRATEEEFEAFDRVMAELLGTPVPGQVISRAASGLRMMVSLQRLGGMLWTQTAETVQVLHHLGAHALAGGVADLPRMWEETRAIKKGQKVQGILSHIETWGGEFGAGGYKMQLPLDPPDNRLDEYMNQDTMIERLLRGGNYAQAKISGFRAMMAMQHRMVAEQITMKAARFFAEDSPQTDKWLADMGIDGELRGHFRLHIHHIAQWDKNGKLIGFDITKLPNKEAANAFVQAVHRGVNQIIQGTFVGETGAWAHNDYLKMLLQLRTFGLTAMEKQWSRSVNVLGGGVEGYSKAAFILMAQIALVTPIYLARVYASSIGREDQEEFIEQRTEPGAMVRGVINYTSMSGMLGDFFDAFYGLAGGVVTDDIKKQMDTAMGERTSGARSVLTTVPALGSIEAAANVAKGNSTVYNALKQLPMSNHPLVAIVINQFKED